ncbi:glycosyltransferase [Actinopolymorpha pittospori]|nr:glycosyltransferase [Actinopolymorpha pittospori]
MVFGTYDTRSHPRVGILAEGLRRHGVEVAECNRPLGIDTAGRVAILRRPWRLPLLALRILRCWAFLARRARAMPAPDAILVGYLGHFDVLVARLLFRRTTIVLDHLIFAADTARDRGETGGVKQALLRGLDRAALRCADVIVVDTEEHRALVPPAYRERAVVALVGAPDEWFEAARPVVSPVVRPGDDSAVGARTRPLRVVFFGVFTPLQGAPVIGAALPLLAGVPVEVTMVGHGQELDRTRALAAGNTQVNWLEWVPPEELPKLVADHDVCLGVFGTGPKALRVVPNKVFQGAAANCAIVTSDTGPQRRALGDAAMYVPPGDAAALADALRTLANSTQKVTYLRSAMGSLARDAFTADQVVRPLLDRLRTPKSQREIS